MIDPISPVFIGSTVLVIALTNVTKGIFPQLEDKWFPAIAIGISGLIALLQIVASVETANLVVTSLVTALTASGAYSQAKAITEARDMRRLEPPAGGY